MSKIKNLKAIYNILSNSSLEESVYTIHSLVDYAIYRWRIEKKRYLLHFEGVNG